MEDIETTLKQSLFKATKAFSKALPLIFGMMLLVSFASLIPKSFYTTVFRGSIFDVLIGDIVGSISAGNPVTSYILGGEMLTNGVSLIAVTSFIVAWVTVGMIQLPAESMMLGKKFAIIRNTLSFLFAIIVAIITVTLYTLI